MRDIMLSLKFASNTFNRVMLAIASTLYAITTAFGPTNIGAHSPIAYQALVLTSGYRWSFAAAFALNAFCLWWRLVDRTPRVAWASFVNIFTATLWMSVTGAEIYVYGWFLPDSVGEVTVTVMAFFSAMRTFKTENDRVTA